MRPGNHGRYLIAARGRGPSLLRDHTFSGGSAPRTRVGTREVRIFLTTRSIAGEVLEKDAAPPHHHCLRISSVFKQQIRFSEQTREFQREGNLLAYVFLNSSYVRAQRQFADQAPKQLDRTDFPTRMV